MSEKQSQIKTILNRMEALPALEYETLKECAYTKVPRPSSIRTWRRPQAGLKHKRAHRRFHFVANVMLKNAQHSVLGRSVNISDSGIFIATEAQHFKTDDELEITIMPFKGSKSYRIKGKIARHGSRSHGGQGYGLIFLGDKNYPASG